MNVNIRDKIVLCDISTISVDCILSRVDHYASLSKREYFLTTHLTKTEILIKDIFLCLHNFIMSI